MNNSCGYGTDTLNKPNIEENQFMPIEYGCSLKTFFPTRTPLTESLIKKGINPIQVHSDNTYTDVHGKCKILYPGKPIVFATYHPYKSEQYFQTRQRASLARPAIGRNTGVVWQIVDLGTGGIIYESHKQ